MQTNTTPDTPEDYCGTTYAAKLLGLSVGTIQTLVEKNELQAWKTQGGHRRISMPSIREYQRKHNMLTIQTEPRDNRLRVLLVEDDAVTREMLRGYCNRSSMPVDCTAMSSGLEALIDISSIKPDVLITDLDMPGVDGFELLRFAERTGLTLASIQQPLAQAEAKGLLARDLVRVWPTEKGFDFLSDLQALFLQD